MSDTPTPLLTAEDLAKVLGTSPTTVQRLCRAKRLEHVRVGRYYKFTPEQIDAAVTVLTVTPSEADVVTAGNEWQRSMRGRRRAVVT